MRPSIENPSGKVSYFEFYMYFGLFFPFLFLWYLSRYEGISPHTYILQYIHRRTQLYFIIYMLIKYINNYYDMESLNVNGYIYFKLCF